MSDILYVSTRGGSKTVTASEAILNGIAADGGLYVPVNFPAPNWDFNVLKDMDYRELAYTVIKEFLTDYTEEELRGCINAAYDGKFDTPLVAPMVNAGNSWYLELYHGATAAFKDMALSLLPHLLVTAAKKNRTGSFKKRSENTGARGLTKVKPMRKHPAALRSPVRVSTNWDLRWIFWVPDTVR